MKDSRPELDSFIDYLQASLDLAQELEDTLESLRSDENRGRDGHVDQRLIDASVA